MSGGCSPLNRFLFGDGMSYSGVMTMCFAWQRFVPMVSDISVGELARQGEDAYLWLPSPLGLVQW